MPSLVLASWRLFFSRLTFVSTLSPGFSWRRSCCFAGLNPEKQQLLCQLKAGESVLTKVRREKNDLQDANTKLGVELKDVRAQLLDSVKENQRLRRGIFSKCLNEL